MRSKRSLSVALFVTLVSLSQSAPNGTSSSSFFPGSAIPITKSNADPYLAQASDFFPSQSSSSSSSTSGLKFPGGSRASKELSLNQDAFIALSEMNGSDEAAANEAIDIILRSARTGKSMDLSSKDGEELVKVASDPVIREKLAEGNEVEARGYIRNKLCGLGLMPCGPPGGGHYGGGGGGHHGHGGGWGQGIPARDVTLVQPVAIKPVGHPIAAVPLEGGHHHKPHYHPGPPPPLHSHQNYGKQGFIGGGGGGYGPPPPQHKPVYHPPKPLRPQYGVPHGGPVSGPILSNGPTYGGPGASFGGPGGNFGGPGGSFGGPGGPGGSFGGPGANFGGPGPSNKAIVEHVHHHVHHTPSTGAVGGPGKYNKTLTDNETHKPNTSS
jgi:hypothetical protein